MQNRSKNTTDNCENISPKSQNIENFPHNTIPYFSILSSGLEKYYNEMII